MSGQKYYAGAVWTNHALERLGQRGLSQELAGQTFQHPEKIETGKDGSLEYTKRFGKSLVTVVAKKNDKGEWIILSNWIDPPLYGTQDYYKKQKYQKFQKSYQEAGFWGKLWLEIKRQLEI